MNYTVQNVGENPRQWGDAPSGPFLDYAVTFAEHADTPVSWSRKVSSPAPAPGQTVDGTIDWTGKFGPKFKQSWDSKTGGASSSTGGGTWKPRDPSETAAIQRQHSQEMALRYASIHPGAGQKMINTSGVAALDQIIKPLIDWFQRDVEAGVKLAAQDTATKQSYGQAREPERTGVSDVPSAPGEFAEPATQGALDDIPF